MPSGTKAWAQLLREIPASADLVSACVRVTEDRASVEMQYVGRKANGEPHQRVSSQSVTIRTNLGREEVFFRKAFPEKMAFDLCLFLPGRRD